MLLLLVFTVTLYCNCKASIGFALCSALSCALYFVLSDLVLPELVECCFTSTETVGLLGTGAQDGRLDFHTAPELCVLFFVHRDFVRDFVKVC